MAATPNDLKTGIIEFLKKDRPETFSMLNLFNAISKKFWNRCQKPSAALFHGLTYALSRATTLLPMADLIIPYKSPLIRFQLLQDLQANEIKQWNSEKTLVSFLTDTFRKHDFSFYAGDAIFSDRISNVIESLSFCTSSGNASSISKRKR
jgi:hypothetical protein